MTLATFNNRGDRRGDSTTLVDPSGDWVMTLYSDQTIAAIVRRREGRGGNLGTSDGYVVILRKILSGGQTLELRHHRTYFSY